MEILVWVVNVQWAKKYLKKIMFSWEEKALKVEFVFFCSFHSIHILWECEPIAKIGFPFFALVGSFFPSPMHLCNVRQSASISTLEVFSGFRKRVKSPPEAWQLVIGEFQSGDGRTRAARWYHTSLSLRLLKCGKCREKTGDHDISRKTNKCASLSPEFFEYFLISNSFSLSSIAICLLRVLRK